MKRMKKKSGTRPSDGKIYVSITKTYYCTVESYTLVSTLVHTLHLSCKREIFMKKKNFLNFDSLVLCWKKKITNKNEKNNNNIKNVFDKMSIITNQTKKNRK